MAQFLGIALSAALLNLSLPPYDVFPLRWISLLPWLWILSHPAITLKRKALLIWVGATLFLWWQGWWIWQLYPLSWAGIQSPSLNVAVIGAAWFFGGIYFALPAMLLALSHYRLVLFPILWVVQEIIRSYSYFFYTYGDGSAWGNQFNIGILGYSLHTSHATPWIAPWLGVYGLSFVVAVINLLIFILFKKSFQKKFAAFAGFFIFLMLISSEFAPLPAIKKAAHALKVVVIQGDNPIRLSYDNEYFLSIANKYATAVRASLIKHPDTDMVVFPENATFFRTWTRLRQASGKRLV